MTRLNVGNIRHPDATTDSITVTSDGDTQINRALGLGGATYGTSGQVLTSAGSGAAPTWQTSAGLQWGDEEVSLSGSGQLWTGIPADVKQVVVAYQAWSNASLSSWICEIGDSGGLETSGYVNVQCYSGSSSSGSTNSSNTSWGMSAFTDPVYISHGVIRITLVEASSNLWECQWLNAVQGTSNGHFWHVGGHKSLSGTLDRVQIRPGTGNFDSGKANLLYLT
jgi:hypothetical protein